MAGLLDKFDPAFGAAGLRHLLKPPYDTAEEVTRFINRVLKEVWPEDDNLQRNYADRPGTDDFQHR